MTSTYYVSAEVAGWRRYDWVLIGPPGYHLNTLWSQFREEYGIGRFASPDDAKDIDWLPRNVSRFVAWCCESKGMMDARPVRLEIFQNPGGTIGISPFRQCADTGTFRTGIRNEMG